MRESARGTKDNGRGQLYRGEHHRRALNLAMLGAGRIGGERGGRAAAHSEDPAAGTSATGLPHIVKEKVRRERLRSQTETGCDHRAVRSAAGHQLNFWRPRGRLFYRVGGGGVCPRRHSRIRLSRREGRTELRGRGSEPLSRGHRNTTIIAVCCTVLVLYATTTQKANLGVPWTLG